MIPPPLPRTLFIELGKLSVVWAHIEQDLILHSSAMAAQDTEGKTLEYLRMDFKRLREKWYSLCRERFDAKTFNKVVHPINTRLALLSPERGYAIHGLWSTTGRGKYHLRFFEQKAQLASYHVDFTLPQLRGLVSASYMVGKDIHNFVTGRHPCFKNRMGTVAKVPTALIPKN